MIVIGRGRPLRAFVLAALVLLTASLVLAQAASAKSRGNRIEVVIPRPKADQVVLGSTDVKMGFSARVAAIGNLTVRRAGGNVPSGYSVAAVRGRQRGDMVTIRFVAVRDSRAARPAGTLRLRFRVGRSGLEYKRATTTVFRIAPETRVRKAPGCATMGGEARRWRVVPGFDTASVEGARFGAKIAVGAAEQIACQKTLPSIPAEAAGRFLQAIDARFADGGGSVTEGFYATWARDEAGNPRICVYARGHRGGDGDVTLNDATNPFTLDDTSGVARLDFGVAGEGEYTFTVRFRQPDGTYRSSRSSLRVPGGGQKGNDPPDPYSAAGNCG